MFSFTARQTARLLGSFLLYLFPFFPLSSLLTKKPNLLSLSLFLSLLSFLFLSQRKKLVSKELRCVERILERILHNSRRCLSLLSSFSFLLSSCRCCCCFWSCFDLQDRHWFSFFFFFGKKEKGKEKRGRERKTTVLEIITFY